jgi:hypothetical protein
MKPSGAGQQFEFVGQMGDVEDCANVGVRLAKTMRAGMSNPLGLGSNNRIGLV